MSNRIKELRKTKNLSQAELAQKLGVSASTIGMYEQDRRKPDKNMLLKLAQVLDVSVDYLIGASDIIKRFDVDKLADEISEHLIENPALMFSSECYTEQELLELCDAIKSTVKKTLQKRLAKNDEQF